MTANGKYPTPWVSLCPENCIWRLKSYILSGMPPNLVPCSDSAGEVVAIGGEVRDWKIGDRVCANFATGFIYGAVTPDIQATALGGQSQGVLTEYRTFPSNVIVPACFPSSRLLIFLAFGSHWLQSRGISPTKRRQLSRKYLINKWRRNLSNRI